MKSVELRQVDMDYRTHQIAYLTFVAKGQKKSGRNKTKPVYPRFDKFYDYESEVNRVLGKKKKSRLAGLAEFMKGGEANNG